MTFNVRKIAKTSFIVLTYIVRIALAGAILWWCFGRYNEWKDFQVFHQWNDHYEFEGDGSYEDPYLIQSADDLIRFSDAVNNGDYFNGVYFRQTADIDLAECDNFVPIGTFDSGYMFRGIYDGAGHRIYNLNINANKLESRFVGLFGRLGGVVMNLGIESGRISGDYVGSFAATDGSYDAMIINCYNRANLYAIVRCGGIADNFTSGRILGCANYGHLAGSVTCQIVSYNCSTISGCCNLQGSHDYMVPTDTFNGRLYDCYVGSNDETELNRYIEAYKLLMVNTEDYTYDIMPWEPVA
ncbi:MAG: hypothetical protein IJ757_04005 [Clostridiales bacterium]|nr:hypothetical protein [Clostridiales bacterium]